MDTGLAIHPGWEYYPAPRTAVPASRGDIDARRGPLPGVPTSGTADLASLTGGGFAQLQARQDELNALARSIREDGRVVEIRKLFPPYPPGQAERMAYLDNMSGLRKQIEALLPNAGAQGVEAASMAERLSRDGRRQLASLAPNQALSTNRPLLEKVAQSDPVH